MDKPFELNTVKRKLRNELPSLEEEYGIEEIALFGSIARNEANPESDLDVLVTFDREIGFLKFIELEERIEQITGKNVDLVTEKALKPKIGKRIQQDKIPL